MSFVLPGTTGQGLWLNETYIQARYGPEITAVVAREAPYMQDFLMRCDRWGLQVSSLPDTPERLVRLTELLSGVFELVCNRTLYTPLLQYLETIPDDHLGFFFHDFFRESSAHFRYKPEVHIPSMPLIDLRPGDILVTGTGIRHSILCTSYPFIKEQPAWSFGVRLFDCTGLGCRDEVYSAGRYKDILEVVRWTGPAEVLPHVIKIAREWLAGARFASFGQLMKCMVGSCFGQYDQEQIRTLLERYLLGEANTALFFCSEMVVICWQMALLLMGYSPQIYLPLRGSYCSPRNLLEIPKYIPEFWVRLQL